MKPLLTLVIVCILQSGNFSAPSPSSSRPSRASRSKQRRQQDDDIITDSETSSYERRRDLHTMWPVERYPNPVLNPEYCRVEGPSSYVCDPDDILLPEQHRSLNHLIRQITTNSKCHCSSCAIDKHGVSIGIAVARSIYRPYNVLPLNNTMEFAESLRKKWKLGVCENDIVILLTTSDRLWYAAYGNKAKRIFPPESLIEITEGNKLSFSAGKYYEGLVSMITQLHSELIHLENVVYEDPISKVEESKTSMIIGIFFLVLIVILLIIVVIWSIVHCIRKRRRRIRSSTQKYSVTGDLVQSSEGQKLKHAEWVSTCVPCGTSDQQQQSSHHRPVIPGNVYSSSNSQSGTTSERRKLNHSSIEEEREPDEHDDGEGTPAFLPDDVYKQTTTTMIAA